MISRYNRLDGRGAFQSDQVRQIDATDPKADPLVCDRIRQATVDIGGGGVIRMR